MNRRQFTKGMAALGVMSLAGGSSMASSGRGKVPMKITDVRTVPVSRYLFVQVCSCR